MFGSYRSYWDFRTHILTKRRYLFDEMVQSFLAEVETTARKRQTTLPANTELWRAQLGHDMEPHYENGEYIADFPVQLPPDRMVPLKGEAREGRANPKGIPYLYLATTYETAMSEVRPWVGALVSVGRFQTTRELRIVDCAQDDKGFRFHFEEPSPELRELDVWSDINRAFSSPIAPTDSSADYVPTQILSELFAKSGYDGISYKSCFPGGHNIVLFDLESAKIRTGHLYRVETMQLTFEETSNPYLVHLNPDC